MTFWSVWDRELNSDHHSVYVRSPNGNYTWWVSRGFQRKRLGGCKWTLGDRDILDEMDMAGMMIRWSHCYGVGKKNKKMMKPKVEEVSIKEGIL